MKTIISREGREPYNNLIPIVEELIRNGNKSKYPEIFLATPGGWECFLEKKIDFDLIREKFELPENVILEESRNFITDSLSFTIIEGG